jgi:hypothetical protein
MTQIFGKSSSGTAAPIKVVGTPVKARSVQVGGNFNILKELKKLQK